MKKFLTSLACLSFVLVGGISLASCGGDKSIVDTSGSYKDATAEEFAEATSGYKATTKGYKFRISIDAEIGEDVDITGLDLEDGTARFDFNGLIDYEGNVFFEGDAYFKGTLQGLEVKYDADGSVYYDNETGTTYRDLNGKKEKYTGSSDSSIFENMFETFGGAVDSEGIIEQYLSDPNGKYQIATSDTYTKIRFDVSETVEGSEDMAEGTFYLILDAEKNFEGFRMEANLYGMSQIIEFVATDSVVEFPSNLDSYVDVI
mgnify:FL=1